VSGCNLALYRTCLAGKLAMKGIGAAVVAIAVLWMADIELNGGRYSEVIVRAVTTLLGR
jgi:hypothetical protein